MRMFNKVPFLMSSVILAVPFLIGQQAHAAIYKCVKAGGDIYYHDKPCPVKEKETEMRAVVDPKDGYIPPVYKKPEEKINNPGVVIGDDSPGVREGQTKKKNKETKLGAKSTEGQGAGNPNGSNQSNSAGVAGKTSTDARPAMPDSPPDGMPPGMPPEGADLSDSLMDDDGKEPMNIEDLIPKLSPPS